MGKEAAVSRSACRVTSGGISERASSMRFWSCWRAIAMSVSGANWAEISVEPRKVRERTRRMPGTSIAACSRGRVTARSIERAGRMPLWPMTRMRGNWSGG